MKRYQVFMQVGMIAENRFTIEADSFVRDGNIITFRIGNEDVAVVTLLGGSYVSLAPEQSKKELPKIATSA